MRARATGSIQSYWRTGGPPARHRYDFQFPVRGSHPKERAAQIEKFVGQRRGPLPGRYLPTNIQLKTIQIRVSNDGEYPPHTGVRLVDRFGGRRRNTERYWCEAKLLKFPRRISFTRVEYLAFLSDNLFAADIWPVAFVAAS